MTRETYTTSVAMLLIHEVRLATIIHANSLPCNFAGWWMMGPTPWALTMLQMKNVIPAMGTTIALAVKR